MRPLPVAQCLGLIHQFEGEAGQPRLCPARDPAGNWEIGWGHKLPNANHPAITAAEADQLALADLGEAALCVCNVLGGRVNTLTDNQYAALIDFTFNEGGHAFAGSTLAAKVAKGDRSAADEFAAWVFAHVNGKAVQLPGLIRRRAAEKALFLT
jgi:GH24 family phage-related lysozyme (muramidase)